MNETLTDLHFWNIVEAMNWNSDFDYNRIEKSIEEGIYGNKITMIYFLNTYKLKYSNLMHIVDNMSDKQYTKYIDKSDDGLSDLLNHIIGCGKKSYENASSTFKGFSKFADSAKESFGYALHIIYDWKEATIENDTSNEKIELKLELDELNERLTSLIELPYKKVYKEISDINLRINNIKAVLI